jgi:SPP1 gp7 family putative phage head morphogenesis protein
MNRIDLAKLAKASGRKGTIVLRPVVPTIAGELELQRIITGMVRQAARFARDHVLPRAIAAKNELHQDDVGGVDWITKALRALLERLIGEAAPFLLRFFRREEERHRGQFESTVKAAFSIDIAPVLSSDDVKPHIDMAMQRSTALIRGISDDVAKRIHIAIIEEATKGSRSVTIAKRLNKEFGIALKRGKFIARDQLATFNGELTGIRQQQCGITKYKWSTVLDSRVRGRPDGIYPSARPSHWDREGKTYSWAKPPEGGPPGVAILCRCFAQPIVEL